MSQLKIRYEWNQLPWRKLGRSVFKLQKRIYQASISKNVKQVHRLQKLLLSSTSGKLLAVRRVTQDNQGRKTAGIDGVANLTKIERLRLVETMNLNEKSKPVRRIWITKPGKLEKRPLGIPIMRERTKQALIKLALEPEWEAKFEPNSYGFRPGRSCHDDCMAIFNALNKKTAFVLDADISGCFDNIDHSALLKKLNTTSLLRRVIKGWLKAGIMESGIFFNTDHGTPQGGVISPLLANIALDGLENDTKQALSKELFKYSKEKSGKGHTAHSQNAISIIRYAYDFVIIHESQGIVQQAKVFVEKWLKNIGLEMKVSKTRITHTFHKIGEQKAGFDFLGFTVRQFPVKQSKRGYKLLIKPSRASQKRHAKVIKGALRSFRTAPQEAVIAKLNPIINGWSRYYIPVVSTQTFARLDCDMHHKLWKWVTRRHSNKGKKWARRKYFRKLGNEKWRFMTDDGKYLAYHADHPIKRHIKIKDRKSPYDGDWIYWSTRLRNMPCNSPRVTKLLKIQNGKCSDCNLWFKADDLIEIHHHDRNHNNNKITNLILLHRHCHDIVHSKKCA